MTWTRIDHDDPTTYPKSGIGVLFVASDRLAVICGAWEASLGQWFDERNEDAPVDHVTHWQPLPALPEAEAKASPTELVELRRELAKAMAVVDAAITWGEIETPELFDALVAGGYISREGKRIQRPK